MPKRMENRWNGVINKSTLEIAKQLLYWQERKNHLTNVVFYSLGACIFLIILFISLNGVNLLNWFDTQIDAIIIAIIVILVFINFHYSALKVKAIFEFKKLKEVLLKKIDAEFCNCGKPCNHKEEYLDYMKAEYDLNLYYL